MDTSMPNRPIPAAPPAAFVFDNSYARELEGLFVPWKPTPVPSPRLLFLNHALAAELQLDAAALDGAPGAALFTGNALPEGAEPIAQAYAGHQFGGFSPQLGDGRALLLGEVIDRHGQRRDIAFKGSGRTPFSRGGDGKAAVGPMLREVLVGEAMHALGIPTTRALAVAATGEPVMREAVLPGAVLTRVAASHIRVGTFQFLAARGDTERLRRLADYTIRRHDPALADAANPALALLDAAVGRQAALIAQWMGVGFIHGVMNTDNMTLSGETIDYGPCAFMEAYDPAAVFSSIDHHGRYAYANQPPIALWNLSRLAEALLPLVADDGERAVAEVTRVLETFEPRYRTHWQTLLRHKLGLQNNSTAGAETDAALVDDWLALLHREHIDFTLAWRHLADAALGQETPLRALFSQPTAPDAWLARWHARCQQGADAAGAGAAAAAAERASRLKTINPRIIPRNHRVEEALTAATTDGDLSLFERLLQALRRPFDDDPALARYAEPAPAELTAGYQTFCGT
jgi:serine/tyrosine/threonine adenylyltransferase